MQVRGDSSECNIEFDKNKTTLVIAHRLSTIHSADKIFVLKNGSIKNSGNHDFLIKIVRNINYFTKSN